MSRPISAAARRPVSSKDARRREQSFKEYEAILEGLKGQFDERWKLNVPANAEAQGATLEDFDRHRTLGTGAFGRVMLVKRKEQASYYAMKILDKARIVKLKQVWSGVLFWDSGGIIIEVLLLWVLVKKRAFRSFE